MMGISEPYALRVQFLLWRLDYSDDTSTVEQ